MQDQEIMGRFQTAANSPVGSQESLQAGPINASTLLEKKRVFQKKLQIKKEEVIESESKVEFLWKR